jgi:ribosomal protein S8
MFNDSISDLLTRIRNANTAHKRLVVMPYSKMKQQVADILKDNRYSVGARWPRHRHRLDFERRHDRPASPQQRLGRRINL